MLNPEKEAEQLTNNTVEIAQCPNCQAVVMHMYFMQDAETKQQSKWYHCSCGILWQAYYKPYEYDQAYLDKLPKGKKYEDACKAIPRLMLPLPEEMMYGRRALMVGSNPAQKEEFVRRGWVTFTIDKNKAFKHSDRLIAADFETFAFPEHTKYNLIWFYHTLESMANPFKALEKATSLLAEDGMINIYGPDADFLHIRGPAGFCHWKRDYNHILWSRKALSTHLEKLGFEIIVVRRNHEQRFPERDDFWLLAQKRFF